jgi:general secretion pathway protein L
VLTHHLGLIVPLEPEDIVFDHAVVGRDAAAQTIRVAVAVARRSAVEAARGTACRLGLRPERMTIGRGEGADGRFDLLRRDGGRDAGALPRRRPARLLEAAAALLLIAASVVHFSRGDQELGRLEAEIATLRQPTDAAMNLRNRIDQLGEPLGFLKERLAAPPRLATLDALTRLLPADVWISQLRVHGREIELAGSAPHAAGLVPKIADPASGFIAPQFRAPVTGGADGSERFSLGFEIVAAPRQR